MTFIHRKSMPLVALSFSLFGAAAALAGCTSADDSAAGPDAGSPDVATLDGGGAADAGQSPGTDPGADAGPRALYKIGGKVTGLHGGGLVLQDNGADPLPIAADGTFTFAAPVTDGDGYDVRIRTQPTNPPQRCTAPNGVGIVAGHDVTGIAVTCTDPSIAIGGTVFGLIGSGMVLENEGGDDLAITQSGVFRFAKQLPTNAPYAVTIKTQPSSPTQTCSVSGGTGTTGTDDVFSAVVNCDTNAYTLGGTVTGLVGTVVVQDEGGSDLTLSANGTFAFPVPRKSGTPYAVTVKTQPSGPTQVCTVTNGSGTITTANVGNVDIACQTQSYTIGGKVVGASSYGVHLQNNGGDDIQAVTSGTFTFRTPILSGGSYHVTLKAQGPIGTTQCYLSNETGVVTNANVTSVTLTCPTSDTWTTVAPMPTPRQLSSAALGKDGRIYVFGGMEVGKASNVVEIYTPEFNTWSTGAPMPTPRWFTAAVMAPDGRMVVMGGNGMGGQLRTVEIYNPSTNSWTTASSFPDALAQPGAALGSDGRIYAFASGHTDAFAIATNTWATVAGNRTNTNQLRGAADSAGGRIYAVNGGSIDSLVPGSDFWVGGPTYAGYATFIGFGLNDDLYLVGDTTLNRWYRGPGLIVPMAPPSVPHGASSGVVMPAPDGRIFAFGGATRQDLIFGTTEVYTP